MNSRTLPCHYDRRHGRVTRDHRDDCPGDSCVGCAPCTAWHCVVCSRTHTTNDQPLTCPDCLAKIRADLDEIADLDHALAIEATDAGRDGRLAAAAPIPGGTAQVLHGPTVRLDMVRFSRHLGDDHLKSDPIPPLAVLAQWEDMWRAYLDHPPAGRATLTRALDYLRLQLSYIAQRSDGPDFLAFTRQVRRLRSQLEHVLHDEQEPERGVECFECGDRLVRRFRQAARCTHRTPARDWFRTLLTYPELDPTPPEVRAARRPCGSCSQGGIDDPSAGLSWECPGCRKQYDPGEYATAVRRDLLDNGDQGDGWTHVTMAAEAASTLTNHLVPPSTVRKWMDRGKVTSCCLWQPGRPWGVRLVFWPDVADEALAAVDRMAAQAARRQPTPTTSRFTA